MIVEIDGERYDVPDDATTEEIDALTKDINSSSTLEGVSGSLHTADVVPEPTVAESVIQHLKNLKESVSPPTSMAELKAAASPTVGKRGVLKSLEQEGKRLGGAVRASGQKIAEDFVALPGVREFPKAAAATGAAGSALVDMISDSLTPSWQQQALGTEGMVGLKAPTPAQMAEMGINPRMGVPDVLKIGKKEFPLDAGFDAASKGIRGVVDSVRPVLEEKVGPRVVKAVFGPSEEATVARLKNPERIKGAKPEQRIAEDFEGDVQGLDAQIKKDTDAAHGTLSTERYLLEPIPGETPVGQTPSVRQSATAKDTLIKIIKDARAGIGQRFDDAAIAAKTKLEDYLERLKPLRSTASEAEVGKMLRGIREDADFSGTPGKDTLNSAILEIQGKMSDILKHNNPAYDEAMAPLAEKVRLLLDLENKFAMKNKPGVGLRAEMDRTPNLLKAAENEKRMKLGSQESLEGLKAATGSDYLDQLAARRLANEFEGGITQGSRRTTPLTQIGGSLGGGVGGVLGYGMAGPMGAIKGASAGATLGGGAGFMAGTVLDVSGRKIAGQLIDAYSKFMAKPETFGKFAGPLGAAAQKGPEAFNKEDFLLQMRDPEYRALKKQQDEETQQ